MIVELPHVQRGDPSGVPVVFLHAYADSWRSFELVLDHLPGSLRALAVTQRGHGDAPKPATGYRVDDFAGDLVSFLGTAATDRAVLVASSSATFTAQQVAVQHPESVGGLVFVGVPWSLREKAPSLDFLQAIAELEDPVDPRFVRAFVEGTSSERVAASFLDAMVEESLKVPARVWRQTLDGLLEAEPGAAGGRIEAPTLLVWGDRDATVPRQDQERFLASIPRSRLLVYEGAGHLVHWEEPERVAADIAAFVADVD